MDIHKKAKQYQDFRTLFDDIEDEIDAVSVATLIFPIFPLPYWPCLWKHVYVEKPLTRTFQESEMLIRAAKKFNVATQMGNQGHCQDNYYQFKTWVEKGIISEVRKSPPI